MADRVDEIGAVHRVKVECRDAAIEQIDERFGDRRVRRSAFKQGNLVWAAHELCVREPILQIFV